MLSAAWLAGVLAGLSVVLDTSFLLLLAGALGLAATGFWAVRLPVMPAVLLVVLLLGVVRAEMHSGQKDGSELIGKEVIASGAIVDDPETAGRLVRFELHLPQVNVGGTKKEIDERWLVYADPPEDLVSHRGAPFFRYGDEVTVHGTPMLPEPIDGFDYASYLEVQGITATVFDEDVRVTGEGGTWWRRAIFASRGKLARSIEQAMPYPESALASAMLLGKRESLPPVLVEKFRGTGAAHLLAISGLHVGVLLAVAAGAGAWLLGRQRPTYLFVAGLIIWVYVLVAGGAPFGDQSGNDGHGVPCGAWSGTTFERPASAGAGGGSYDRRESWADSASQLSVELRCRRWNRPCAGSFWRQIQLGFVSVDWTGKEIAGLGDRAECGLVGRHPGYLATGGRELWGGCADGRPGVAAHGSGNGSTHWNRIGGRGCWTCFSAAG